ncbi:MAG TPA: EAL domain-containing protein [Edaphobacter sp.]|nr:EAL domain-containing protein [Edaphobacter sp.]
MKPLSLRGVVTAIGASVALITAIALPAGYLASNYLNLSEHLDFKADLNSSYLAKYINSQDTMWRFQRVRLAELLSQTDGADTNFRKRVVDSSSKVVLVEGDVPGTPTLVSRRPITVAGSNVGHIEIEASLRPLLEDSALIASFSALLGLCIFFAIRIFPLRILDRTMGQLERSNRDLVQINGRFDTALNNMSHGLCMFDSEGRLVVKNQQYLQVYNLSPEVVKPECTFLDLLKHRAMRGYFNGDPDVHWAEMQDQMKTGKPATWVDEYGNGHAITVTSSPMPNGGWVVTHEDITEQRTVQAKISHMALHDALTNLPNRLFFREQIETRLGQLGRDEKFAVLCFDLDKFKSVNDTLGHAFGDELLRQVAERMGKCLRKGDTLARLGGDEFAIFQAHGGQAEDASALAVRLIGEIGAPFDLDGHQVVIGVSIGIAIAPRDATESDQLLKSADMALYRAKAEGRGTYRFFEPEMDRLMQARRALELDLRKAIVNNEFEVYYQPLINLQSEQICGFEALLRWNHPERGLIPPLDFIPLAEETTLIVPIGEWVIRNACDEAAKWPKEIRVAINLSPVQFQMRNLSQMVMSALAHSGLAAERLELEITESVLLVDNVATLEILHQLRSLGVRISMDDFGTGYSSLSYLRSFPFDKIKIDRSFVHDLQQNADSKAIVRAVTGLGASLGMATTGEGVETREEVDYLRREGCTEAQGYFFSAAKPASEVYNMLAERNAVSAVA